jgi:hypothetical protein
MMPVRPANLRGEKLRFINERQLEDAILEDLKARDYAQEKNVIPMPRTTARRSANARQLTTNHRHLTGCNGEKAMAPPPKDGGDRRSSPTTR